MLRHERTQRHRTNLNNTNNKQIEQPVLSDKEKNRIRHQETIDNLNDVFSSFQTPDWQTQTIKPQQPKQLSPSSKHRKSQKS